MIACLAMVAISCAKNVRPRPEPQVPAAQSGYLQGKLPGERWVEHNPPRYGALQSFELRISTGAFFFLSRGQKEVTLKEQLNKLIKARKASPKEIKQEENLPGENLIWLRYTISQKNGITRFYLTKTDDQNVFWVIFFANSAENFAIYAPDIHSFVKNLDYVAQKPNL